MTELKLPSPGTGDALSQMLQITGRAAGLTDWRWSGNGLQDIEQLVRTTANVRAANTQLMKSLAEIVNIPEFAALQREREDIGARVALLVLRSRAMIDLSTQAKMKEPQNAPSRPT